MQNIALLSNLTQVKILGSGGTRRNVLSVGRPKVARLFLSALRLLEWTKSESVAGPSLSHWHNRFTTVV